MANHSKEREFVVLSSFVNGHTTIVNVPYVVRYKQDKLVAGNRYIRSSVLKNLAYITEYMQESGLTHYDYKRSFNHAK